MKVYLCSCCIPPTSNLRWFINTPLRICTKIMWNFISRKGITLSWIWFLFCFLIVQFDSIGICSVNSLAYLFTWAFVVCLTDLFTDCSVIYALFSLHCSCLFPFDWHFDRLLTVPVHITLFIFSIWLRFLKFIYLD